MKLKIYISIIILLNAITFTSIAQPLASVSPDSLSATLINCNDSVEIPITIYNSGTSDLTYNIFESFNSVPTGYCTPTTGYCCPDGCGDGDFINNFTFNTISNLNSSCNGQSDGYISYPSTSYTTNVLPSGTYNISMQAGGYSEGFGVWIDYNRDGDFDDTNEFVYSSPSASTSLFSSTVTIPSSASYGKTMLRVRCSYSSLVTATDICNEFYYSETEDYEITIGAPFITATPNIGTIASGDSVIVQVKFNAIGMNVGNYLNYLTINTDDALNPIFTIPCFLTFIGVPEIAISANNLNFDSIMQGATKIDSFLISNLGCGNLDITDITNLNSDYIVNSTSFTILPGESQYIFVTFNPQSLGDFYDTLNIINNDSNLTVSLYGYATSPPVMSWSPNSIDVTINTCNDSVVLPLTIYNTGNYVLNYAIENQQILSALCTPLTTSYCCGMGINNVTFNTINKPSPDGVENYKDFSATSVTTVISGQTYTISVNTGISYNEHVFAWIDYNNNAIFEANEKILESIDQYINHSANVTIPNNAVMQTPLRMRIISEYSWNAYPQSCNNVQYGQCEDYAVIIGDMLSLSNTFGTVLPNDSNIINLTFHTESILAGTYTNNIVFNSNDPLHLTDSIQYTLNYNGYPVISSSVNCIDLDSILQFNSTSDSMWFYNIGCDSLNITNITNSNAAFVTDTTTFIIYPGDSAKLFVTFSPSTIGDVYDTLNIINDDSLITICLHGYAFPPPIASFTPQSFNVTLNTCNEIDSLPLTITNTGVYQLDWNLSTITEKSLSFDGNDYVSVANTNTLPTGSVMTVEAWIYPTSYTDASYNGVVSFGPRWCTGSSFLLSMTNAGRPSFASWCNDFVPSTGPTATLNSWNHIAAVLNGNSITLYLNGYSWTTTMGTVPNIQNGYPCNIGCTDNTGRFFNGQIDEVRIWNTARTASEISNNQYHSIEPVQNGLQAYFKFNEGNGNSVIDFTGNSHTGTINGSIFNFSSPISNIISLSSSNGTVVTGDTTIVNITFDSNDLIAGTYNQEIVFTSNDPLLSSDTISCTIIYNGYPIMSVSDSCLAFDSLIQYQSFTDTIWFVNSGCDSLKITNISNTTASFTVSPSVFSVFPNDSAMLVVTFSPQNFGINLDTLHIITNDYNVDICLSGYAFYPPIISYLPDSIDVSLTQCNDSITVPLTIYNIGDTTLSFNLSENIDGSALQLDGSNDYVDLGNWFNYQTFTIEMWVNPGTAQQQYADIFDNNHSGGRSFVLQQNSTNTNQYGWGSNDGGSGALFSLTPNQWSHIAVTRDGNTKTNKVYVNGTLVSNFVGTVNIPYDGSQYFRLARWGGGGRYWNGTMDEVRVWNEAKSQQQILDRMNRQLYGSEAGLIAYWNLNEGTGTIANDLSGNNHTATINNGAVWSTNRAALYTFITTDTFSGSIASSDSSIVNITISSTDLVTGEYSSSIIINSNDPLSSSDTIDVNLHFTGYPLISSSVNCLQFDSVIQYSSFTDSLWFINIGCDTLIISDITNNTTSFSIDTNYIQIPPRDSSLLYVSFIPNVIGDIFDTLHITNNDVDIDICLQGYAFSPPIILHSPDSIIALVNTCNDSVTIPLTIYNIGDYDLIYSINNSTILPAQCVPITTGYCCDMGIKNVKFNTINNTTPNGSEGYKNFTATQQTRVLSGQTYNLYAQTGVQYNEHVLAWIDYNNNGTFETSEKVLESISQFINHSANVTIPTNAVENTPLRMRIISDYYWNATPQPCNNVQYGQCEDYTVMIGNRITLSNNLDTVAQNDSSIVNITFYTDELLSGNYTGNILISSNDPLNAVDSIKFDLILNGYPIISLSDSCLEFDSIIQYNSKVDSMWVYNSGCDTLNVTNINSLTSYFYADTTLFNILPNDSMQIFITFNTDITGHIYDTLEIINNDTILHVCLHGYSIIPPFITYNPDSIYLTINTCNDSVSVPITIYNTGDSPLDWSFSVDACTVSDDFEPAIDNSLWTTIDGGVASANCSFYSAGNALYFDGDPRQAITRSFNTILGGQIEFYLKLGTGGSPCENADGGEDVTLQYSIDNGNNWIDINIYLADNYPNFTLIQENIPILACTNNTLFRWIQFSHSGSGYDNWAIDDVAFNNITNNIVLDSISGTIATGDSTIINATFLTDELVTGIYNNLLIINSNDPLSPIDTIITTVEYNGYPVVSLSDTCLLFDTIVQWDNDIQSFYVYNTGCDTLFVSNIISDLPEFTTTDTLFALFPNDSALVSVNFAPVTVGNFNGTLSIISNTTIKTLCLIGVSIVPPQISFSPATLTANITACNDTFTTPLTIYNSGDYQLIYSIGSSIIQSPLCMPTTTAYCCGMGITRFALNTIDYVTSDGSDGYSDYSSFMQTQLIPSQTYPVTVRTGNTYTENVRIWIDFNNNGTFDASEKVFESLNQMLNHSGNITIPANSVLQTPLRLRVGSDLGTNAIPQPCNNVEYGQFEDYTVIIGSGINFTNSSDTILSGDSAIVNVNLDATIATPGTFSYSVVINSNDPLNPIVEVPFDIVIAPLPTQPVVTDEAICFGTATPDLVATGTNVNWFSDGALTTNIFTGNNFNNGETAVSQYTYYVTQTVNNCQSPSDTIILSINPVYNLSDVQSICNGDSYIFGTQTLTISGIYVKTFQTVNGCDSVVTLTLTVNPTYSEVALQTICNGDSLIFGTQTLTTSGTYIETFQTVNGCDSVVTLTFTVYPTYNVTDSTSITCGGSYTFGTQTLTTAGIYVETFNTINSCDSVVTLTLTMIPTYTVFDNATICDGDVFAFGTQSLTIAGTYDETFSAQDGCDSLVSLILTVNPVFATTDSASITCGNSYTFGTQTLTVAGVYNETFTAINACDSVVTLTLYMIPSYTTTDSVAICNGDSYIFGTQTLSANGVYNETFTAGDGCDSLVTLTLYIKPTFSSLDAATICNGDSYTLGTQTLTIAGAYVETFTAINGCDSVVYFSLSVNPTYSVTDSTAICQGDSYIFGTQTLTSAGVYVETFNSINGCDSVVTLTLTINPIFAGVDVATICNGDVFVFGTQNLTTAGNYSETFSSVYGCDSMVVLTLSVNPTFAENDTAIICNGDNFVFGTQTLTIAGVYNETFTAINGCDSVVTLTLNVNPIYSEVDSDSITCGASLVFGTQTLTSAGIYNETFASINGCDSVVTLTLSMLPSYATLQSATICNGDSYTFGTQTLTIAGVYNETFTAVDGCDSLVTFTLTVSPTYATLSEVEVCDGDSYTFGTQTLTTTGVYNETFTTINGCDSVVTLTFTVNSTYNVTDSTAICNGNSFTFGTQTLTIAGVYVETFSSISGCDSLVTLTLTVNPVYSETDSATICDSDSYIFGTQTLSVAGVYSETFSTVNGCDSVVSLTLFVNPVYAELDTASITCGASYIFGTQTLTSAGNYTETFSSINGCDSVVTLTLQMLPSYITNDNAALCDGDTLVFGSQNLTLAGNYSETFTALTDGCDSLVNLTLNVSPVYAETDSVSIICGALYIFGTQILTSAGVYTETFNSIVGCDSVVTLTLYMIPEFIEIDSATICDGDSIVFGTQILKIAGTYSELFTAINGCDSLVTLTLFVNPIVTSSDAVSICDGDSYIFGTQTLTIAGVYNETFTSTINGCDSVVTLTLTINYSNAGIDVQTACESYDWIDGNTYTASTSTPTYTLINAAGCDSIVTLNLTINNSNTGIDVQTACDTYDWIDGNTYISSTNTPTFTLTNSAGCDSVVTLNLTINNSNTGTDIQTGCNSFTWIDGNTYISSTNTPTFTLMNSAGCDSVVTLNLTINNSNIVTDVQTACDSYTWIDGNTYISSTNTPTFTLLNAAGCDSLVTLNLTINVSTSSTTNITACETYTWLANSTTYTVGGTYTAILANTAGCDSVATLNLTINPVYSDSISASITCGGSYIFNADTLTLAGIYYDSLTTVNSCDSVIVLTLTMIPAYTVFDADTICEGTPFTFGTQTLTIAGVYNETFVAIDGCDSLVTLTLTVNPSYSDTTTASINCGETYPFAGQNYTIAGTYYDSLFTTLGCDSVKVLNLSVNPEFSISYPAEICDGEEYVFGTDTLTTAGTYYETFVAIDGCDSLVTLNLFVLPVYSVTDNASICDGDSYIFGTQTLTTSGVYYDTLSTISGCDSVIILNFTVMPHSYLTINDSILCGQTYDFYGTILDSANTYTHTLVAANGCDSIITLNLSMIPSFVTTDLGIICDGDEFIFGTQTLTVAGVYNETFTATNGCDSLVSFTLSVKPTPQTNILDSISCGETYSFDGLTLSLAGTYYDTLIAANGCDSIVTLYLAMRPSFITPLTATICDGAQYLFGTDTLTAQGVYNHTLTAINGCDSLVTLTLTITPIPATPVIADLTKCTGSVYPTFTSSTVVNWFADSLLTTLLSASPSYIPLDSTAGTYNYYVTQTENNCTSLYETATLQIYQTPAAPISSNSGVCFGNVNPILFASGTNICWYSNILLTDTLTVGNAYQPTVNAVGSYYYYITQRSDYCGVSPYTMVSFEITNPSAAPQANNVAVCFGTQTPDLSILPPFGIVNWYSEPELVTLINTGSTFTTGLTNVGEYTFYFTQTYSGCVSSTGSVTLTINPKPLVTLDNYYVAINKGDSVTINAYNADSYTWTPALGLNTTIGSQVIASPQNTTIYVVTGTNSEGCSDSASCKVEVGQIGVDEASLSQSVNVYPNPADNYLTVEYTSSHRDNIRIVIYNALNQIIFTKDVIAENGELIETINLENLPDAIYNLQIIRDNSIINKKIIIKH